MKSDPFRFSIDIVRTSSRRIVASFSFKNALTAPRWLAAYALLNAPFWLWGQHYFISRPWFNVDLFFPVVLAAISRRFALVALACIWVLDAVVSQSSTFYFTSPLDFLRSVQHAADLSVHEYLSFERLRVAMPFAIAALLLPVAIPKGLKGMWIAVTIPALFAFADIANGSSMLSTRAVRLVNANIAGSPITTLMVRARNEENSAQLHPLGLSESTRGLVNIEAWARKHPNRSAVFLLTESFGIHDSALVRAWLRDQLWNPALQGRYQLLEGHVPFHGSTTNGELRELCSVAGSYRRLLDGSNELSCLPQQLSNLGWTTTGLHGFSQDMFRRGEWWPRTGLQHAKFAEQLLTPNSSRCGGAFSGACDADVIAEAFLIVNAPRQFVYVLTLNSHLPIKHEKLSDELLQKCLAASMEDADCQFVGAIGKVLRAVSLGATDSQVGHLPLIVLVGDHAPPFADITIRKHYSQSDVQAYALVPRE